MIRIPIDKTPDDLSTAYIVLLFNQDMPRYRSHLKRLTEAIDTLRKHYQLGHMCRRDFSRGDLVNMKNTEEHYQRYLGFLALSELYNGPEHADRRVLEEYEVSLFQAQLMQSKYLSGGLLALFLMSENGPIHATKNAFSDWFVQFYDDWEAQI